MNVNDLKLLSLPQLQRISKDASEKDADFLALRLLNKRSRLRLSPEPIDLNHLPLRTRLFAVANSKAWFAAAIRNSDGSDALALSPLQDLRSVLSSSSSDGPLAFQSRVNVPLPATPHILTFTQDDSRLLVAFVHGPIGIYDSRSLFQGSATSPVHTFTYPKPVRNLYPSTGDAEHVAVLRDPGDPLSVEILDVQKMLSVGGWNGGGSLGTNPTSVSWSPKGKQIAIGLDNGDIVTFSPADTSTVKSVVPHPPCVEGQTTISIMWLSNTEFHAIYVPAGPLTSDSEQTHLILSLEPKLSTVGDAKFTTPYLPFPGLRPPGSSVVILRSWEPSRILLFVGDNTSSDIGLIGSLSETSATTLDSWYNLTLEETSTPSVPLDADLNDTVIVGLELDLTSSQSYKYTGPSGEDTGVPPPPIMYLYANDGTLTGWHIIQTQGAPYPGMTSSSVAASPNSAQVPVVPSPPGTFDTPSSPFASTPSPIAPSTGVAFGFSAFSGPSSAFGGPSSRFGSQQQQPPPIQTSLAAPALSAPSLSVEMSSAVDDSMVSDTGSGFGYLSLGGSGQSRSGSESGNSMFGTPIAPAQPSSSPFAAGPTSSSTFGTFGAGPIKPATGLGAFAGTAPSAFGSSGAFGGNRAFGSGTLSGGTAATSTTPETKPASVFGQSSFGASSQAAPAFGQSSFGQSSFGQSSFGKPAFGSSGTGAPSTPSTPSTFNSAPSKGGFAAFASNQTASFGSVIKKTPDAKPVWAQAAQKTPDNIAETSFTPTSTPVGGAFAGLAQSSKGSAFGKTALGQPKWGQMTFGQPSTPASAGHKAEPSSVSGGGGFSSFANAGPSAFGTATTQQSPDRDAKPVHPTSSTEKQNGSERPKSVFGIGAVGVSATPQTAPAPASTTPASSPEMPSVTTFPPTPATKQADVPIAITKPTTVPAPPTGAFGGLTTSTTSFQSGFGAFGSTTTPTSSPFFQKPGLTPSVFGQTSFGSPVTTTPTATPPSKDGTTNEKFGAPSFGSGGFTGFFGNPPSPTSATPSTPTTTSLKSAFSAFSGGSNPFGAAVTSSSGKSFGEMLRQKEGEEQSKAGKSDDKNDERKSPELSRTAEEWKKPVSAFASLKNIEVKTLDKGKEAEEDEGEAEDDEGPDTSFRDDDDEYRSDNGDDSDDGIDAFLKSDDEDLGSDEEEDEASDGEEAEEDAAVASQTPPASPTVKQATQPKTPQPQSPNVSASPSPTLDKEAVPQPVPVRAGSTTPSTSPADRSAKPLAPTVSRATSAPPSTAPTSTPNVGALLGVGRPSTRPARSSPLANRPISGDDDSEEEEKEEEKEQSPSQAKKARSASPAVPVPTGPTSRPKTPPGLFGAPVAPPKLAPFSLGPAKSPSPLAGKSVEPTKPSSASASPTLSGPGTPGGPSLFGGSAPVFTPPPVPQGGLFGPKPLAPAPISQPSVFGQKPSGPIFGGASLPAPPNATPTKPSSPSPSSAPLVSALSPTLSGFGMPVTASSIGAAPPRAFSSPQPQPQLPSQPLTSPAQDMQSEFLNLYHSLTRELEDLKALAAQASSRTAQLARPGSGTKTIQDVAEPTKWVLSDLPQFTQIMKEVERGLERWEQEKVTCISYMRELESNMLKGSTRKEEIERFTRASKDADFAKMLKARMLSPDHLETQAQLRRDIRTIRGRLRQLEDYIQASKKKLNSLTKGKPTIKPPSLETINRTYNNIDRTIEQDEESVSALTERFEKLEFSSSATPLLFFSASTRDRRLPDCTPRREVTPNIAASTAAALNAERSAQKLKRALLSARKQPLLNTKAVDAFPPDREPRAPRKPLFTPEPGPGVGEAFAAGLNGSLPTSTTSVPIKPEPVTSVMQWSAPPGSIPGPAWSLPPFELEAIGGSLLTGLGGMRQRAMREKQHAKPIQIGSAGKPLPPPPAGFSWGPVPVIPPKNTISIFAGLGDKERKKREGESAVGLGGSWVADGFGEGTPMQKT